METQLHNTTRLDLQARCEHPLGRLVSQTADMSEHNRGVRGLLNTASIRLVGLKILAFCPDCGDNLQIPTQALTIDPLV